MIKPIRLDEQPTPLGLEQEYNDDEVTRRRSMQLSIPDPTMSAKMRLQTTILGMSFSEVTRYLWEPHIKVLDEILQAAGHVNEYGGLSDPREIAFDITANRKEFLRKYVKLCKERGIDTDWMITGEL
jgi:hypothetical protein